MRTLSVQRPGGKRPRVGLLALLSGAVASSALLPGCTVGPNYAPPVISPPQNFSENVSGMPSVEWWKNFNDAQLDNLIDRALQTNLDVRAATARIRQARAQRGVIAAGEYPTVNVTGAFSRSLRSQNGSSFGVTGSNTGTSTGGGGTAGGGTGTGSGTGTTSVITGGSKRNNLYQAGFDASWEIDVFGGVRRQVEGADANINAAIEDRRNVMVTLLGEVATDYIQLRGAQRRIQIARENLKSQRDTLQLTENKFKAGVDDALNVAQTQALVASTEATIPTLEISSRQSIHALSTLLGEDPDALLKELGDPKPIPTAKIPRVPLGLPSDLLQRRPDIRRAEQQLHAATANIGVATADLFPRFALTGTIGQQGNTVKRFFNSSSEFWSFGPSVSWPILDFGAIRSNIRVQDALQEQSLIAYEQSILTALSEVENSLIAYGQEQIRLKSLDAAVDANKQAVDLSLKKQAAGVIDFLNVLTSEQSLFSAQDAEVQSQTNVQTNLVALYKALGGGWEVVDGAPGSYGAATQPATAAH